jgi:ribulose-phosphate 3-epimerase
LNKKIEFYASTISDDPEFIFEHLPIFKNYGISGIHFDVMDGNFVPRLGLYPELLKSISKYSDLSIEAHLMLSNPDKYIEVFVEAGAQRVLVHFESLQDPFRTLRIIHALGVDSCVVLNPETNFYKVEPFITEIDSIMIMAINPGVPKHPFIPSALDKLRDLKNWVSVLKPELAIGIDGGVTFDNAKQLHEYGADWLICGSGTIFKPGESLIENISKLHSIFVD